MTEHIFSIPDRDPVSIFEIFNASFGSKLLTAASIDFKLFERIKDKPMSLAELGNELNLSERAINVLVTAMRAFELLEIDNEKRLHLSDLARSHLVKSEKHDVSDYLYLAAEAEGVKKLAQRLREDSPGYSSQYIKNEGVPSVMDDPVMADWLTERLVGRAKNTSLLLAECAPVPSAKLLLDVGGGAGISTIAYLQKYPQLRAIVLDLPQVLKVTERYAKEHGVWDRLQCYPADMFEAPLLPDNVAPHSVDVILLSNVLHDWGIPKCRFLVNKCANILGPGGQLIIHDAFLNDELDGPYDIAIYSIILFYLTEGRAYSVAECREWLSDAGLTIKSIHATMCHCSAILALKEHHL